MIFAELRGKLGREYRLAHERGEDLLTSTVFQLLRYLPIEEGFNRVLAAATPASTDWISFGDPERAEVELWPRWPGVGVPDVVITLFETSRPTWMIAIEAKLDAGKSGRALAVEDDLLEHDAPGADVEETDIVPFDRDQLAKYWQALQRQAPTHDVQSAVIYLTSHLTPPRDELDESLAADPTMRLAWLSWFDVWKTANDAARAGGDFAAQDLAALLRHRGFATFTGFAMRGNSWPVDGKFFAARDWFSHASPLWPRSGRFWSKR